MLIAVLALGIFSSLAQGQDNSGNEFFLLFHRNGGPQTNVIFVTAAGDEQVNFNVSAPRMGFHTASSVEPGEVKSFTFDASYVLTSTIDRSKGIVVTAEGDKKLVVYGANEAQSSTDTFLALSPQTLDTYRYIGVSYAGPHGQSVVIIVATEDSTMLSVTPSEDITIGSQYTAANTTLIITLKRAETLLIQSPGDLTGTIVTSNKAISFFSGHECTNIPSGYTACDVIVEQFPPVGHWGNKFATAPLKERKKYDLFRIVSGEDANNIYINCTTTGGTNGLTISFTLGEAEYRDVIIPSTQYCWIEGINKTMIVQFSVGQEVDNVPSDPFMTMVPPYDQYSSKYTLVTVPPVIQSYTHYLNIFIRSLFYQPDEILLNGQPISKLNTYTFVPIKRFGVTEVYAAQIDIAGGVQTIEHNSSKTAQIGVIVYGYGSYNSYGYPGGLTFKTGRAEDTIDRLGVVETKKSPRSVTVNWFKPITVNPVLHYDVSVLEKLIVSKDLLLVQNFTTKETKAEIKNLKPATNYSVKVKAVVDGDEDVPETTIDVATEKSSKVDIPKVEIVFLRKTSIGVLIAYRISPNAPSDFQPDGFRIRIRPANMRSWTNRDIGPKARFYHTPLAFGHRYCFKVNARLGMRYGKSKGKCMKLI